MRYPPGELFFCFGMAHVVSLFPGVSRSGICITAGLVAGYSRTQTTRFAFLMGIPTITAAATFRDLPSVSGLGSAAIGDSPAGSQCRLSYRLRAIFFALHWHIITLRNLSYSARGYFVEPIAPSLQVFTHTTAP